MGKKSSKTKSTSDPWKPAQPYLLGAAGQISDTVANNQGNLDAQAGQIRSFLPGLGEQAFGQNAGLNAATGYAQDVLGGKYLGSGNEYLNNMVNMTKGHVGDDINTMFSKAGRVGGDSHYADLSRGLGEAELGLRYQDYGNERNAMTQAAGMMPGLVSAQYAGVAPYLAAQQTAANIPYAGIGNLGQMGNLFGGYGTQTQTQPGGWGQGLLGAAASLGSAAISKYSDRSAKTKIEKLGDWDGRGDGLAKYRFAYKWAPSEIQEGVMADEVEKLRPWALGPERNGYKTVNYAKLSEAA